MQCIIDRGMNFHQALLGEAPLPFRRLIYDVCPF